MFLVYPIAKEHRMDPIAQAAREIHEAQQRLYDGELDADGMRAVFRALRERLGEDDFMAAKFKFAAMTSARS